LRQMIRPRNIFRPRGRAGRASRVIVDLNERISTSLKGQSDEALKRSRGVLTFDSTLQRFTASTKNPNRVLGPGF
jgi:hypothetical protein